MSDFYMEQVDNGYVFEGAGEGPPGRVTICGPKFQSFQSEDPAKNTLLDIRNYRGQISIGPCQFYMEPKRMRMKQQGMDPVELFIWASSWYETRPDPRLNSTSELISSGNEFFGKKNDKETLEDQAFFRQASADAKLEGLVRALDDLRRLGEADLRLNHPALRQ